MSWFLAFAGFAVLIILHEFGHFAAAKATGMRVERFFLFFPPKLVSVKRGDTEYGVGAIPLGGFVKITGMNPDEELPEEVASRGYYAQPVWKRIVVIAAGPAVNLLIAFLIFFFIFLGREESTNTVGEISAGTPAAQALEQGDEIVAVDGVRGDVEALREQIASHECAGDAADGCAAATPATLVVVRNGEQRRITARPEYDAEAERMLLGFQYGTRPANLSVGEAAGESVDFMWFVTSQTISTIAQIFDPEKREEISGVVGGYETTRQAIDFDGRTALLLLGVISLSLAVINLFPFLPLDGGHIFWSLVEKVRGKPVPFRVMERAGVVGFALVLMLFFVGLTNDIGRLTGEGFGPR